jgi:DNA-binding NtrC family response regulator
VSRTASTKATVRVLAALTHSGDRAALQNVFRHSNWDLEFAENYDEVASALSVANVGVAITQTQFGDGHDWKDVLELTRAMMIPVPVVVTDDLADEQLWAEVLNLGAYDLLVKPFDPTEVYRVVSSAWLCWHGKVRTNGLAGGSI